MKVVFSLCFKTLTIMRDLPDQLILDGRLNATELRKLKKRGREKEDLLGQSEPKRKVTVAS